MNYAEAVKLARNVAKKEARQACGRKGLIESRGAWIIVRVPGEGDPKVSEGMCEFKGTQKQIAEILAEYPGADVSIEGGFNWAACVADFADGSYDPWVSEWVVNVERSEA